MVCAVSISRTMALIWSWLNRGFGMIDSQNAPLRHPEMAWRDGTNGGLLHGDDFTHIDVDGCGLLDEVDPNDETIVACLPE